MKNFDHELSYVHCTHLTSPSAALQQLLQPSSAEWNTRSSLGRFDGILLSSGLRNSLTVRRPVLLCRGSEGKLHRQFGSRARSWRTAPAYNLYIPEAFLKIRHLSGHNFSRTTRLSGIPLMCTALASPLAPYDSIQRTDNAVPIYKSFSAEGESTDKSGIPASLRIVRELLQDRPRLCMIGSNQLVPTDVMVHTSCSRHGLKSL